MINVCNIPDKKFVECCECGNTSKAIVTLCIGECLFELCDDCARDIIWKLEDEIYE